MESDNESEFEFDPVQYSTGRLLQYLMFTEEVVFELVDGVSQGYDNFRKVFVDALFLLCV